MLLGVSFRIDYSDQVDGVYLYTPKLGLYHEVDISFGDTGAMFPSLTASSWLDLFIAAITSR
jgi:hypothetical protein